MRELPGDFTASVAQKNRICTAFLLAFFTGSISCCHMVLFRSLAWVIFCFFTLFFNASVLKAEPTPPSQSQKADELNDIHRRGGMLLAMTAVTVAVVGFVLARKRQIHPPEVPPPSRKDVDR
jgi:hypothetical protein